MNIVYQFLDQTTYQECIDCVTSHFLKEEYLTRESKLTTEEFGALVKAYCDVDLTEKLSIVAIDTISKKIIGFAISEDLKGKNGVDAHKYTRLSKNFIPFFDVLEKLHEKCFHLNVQEGECFHLFLLGVLPDYQGKKIGKTLVQLSEAHAKERKFKHIMLEATSPITKPLCEGLNYTNLGNIVYQDYTLDGTKPFSHLTDYDGPYMFLKDLV